MNSSSSKHSSSSSQVSQILQEKLFNRVREMTHHPSTNSLLAQCWTSLVCFSSTLFLLSFPMSSSRDGSWSSTTHAHLSCSCSWWRSHHACLCCQLSFVRFKTFLHMPFALICGNLMSSSCAAIFLLVCPFIFGSRYFGKDLVFQKGTCFWWPVFKFSTSGVSGKLVTSSLL